MDTLTYALLTVANAALWVALAHIWDERAIKPSEKDTDND
jgi:hypothetical protein